MPEQKDFSFVPEGVPADAKHPRAKKGQKSVREFLEPKPKKDKVSEGARVPKEPDDELREGRQNY